MRPLPWISWWDDHQPLLRRILAPLLLVMVVLVATVVFATGGIKFVYSHSMYIPILLGGLVYGVRGGVIVGVLGGLALGPYMPIDVLAGEMQPTVNWLYRMAFFVLVGLLAGIASDLARSYLAQLRWVSRHDPSTRLPNRVALMEHLARAQRTSRPSEASPEPQFLAVLSIVNVMELKAVLGFPVVRQAIRQLADRLDGTLPDNATTFRVDSEQLAVHVPLQTRDEASALQRLLLAGAEQPFLCDDVSIHLETRMGYAVCDPREEGPEAWLQQAQAALIVSARKSLPSTMFNNEITSSTRENLSMLADLRKAMLSDQVTLHFQPKVHLHTGALVGAEALVRWTHPERGIIAPGVFIPRAEESTLIHTVTEVVLGKAMAAQRTWQRAGLEVPVAVNVSTRDLQQPGFTDMVFRLLEAHDMPGEMLELELTENALMTDIDRSVRVLQSLASQGVLCSIDDFGTGYCSLQYLHRLPLSTVKIDQSFVLAIHKDEHARHVLEATLALASRLRLHSVAEGVESAEALEALKETECSVVQGYFIARPMPSDDFIQWCTGRTQGVMQLTPLLTRFSGQHAMA